MYFAAFRSVINKAAFRHEVYEATYTRARTSNTHVLAIAMTEYMTLYVAEAF